MVGEFPELQGIMGGYYAAHDGEAADVVAAIRGQYANRRGESDAVAPINRVGEALVIADRAEALVGIWGIGLKPTGDKDPYALRRHALTLIDSFERVAGGSGGRLALRELLDVAAATFDGALSGAVVDEVEAFVYERYFQRLATSHDVRAVDAVISTRPALHDVVGRLLAVREFLALPEAPALAAANKRVGNILKKSDAAAATIDPALLRRARRAGAGRRPRRHRQARRQRLRAGRVRSVAQTPRRPQALGRCLLRQRHGQRRLAGAARQSPGAAGGAANDHEPRRRPVAPRRLSAADEAALASLTAFREGATAPAGDRAALT